MHKYPILICKKAGYHKKNNENGSLKIIFLECKKSHECNYYAIKIFTKANAS